MKSRDDEHLVREICHEVDLLVTSDPRVPDLDGLEKARLKMNDLLWQGRYGEAEVLAYTILLVQSGDEARRHLLEEVGDQ
ncbi:MAG: hypothetical protein ABFD90_08745 [Phycisphaerales bacterium]